MTPLEQARRERGWSRTETANRLGLNRSHYWRIEAGQNRPSPELADRIEKLFGKAVTRDQLLFPADYIQKTARKAKNREDDQRGVSSL